MSPCRWASDDLPFVSGRSWPSQVGCISEEPAQQKFEPPSLPTRMDAGFPQKLLTFSGKYGNEGVSKSA